MRRPYPFRFLRLSPNSLTVCFSSYGCLNPTVCALRTAYTVHSNPFLQCYSLPSTLTLPSLHCVQPTLCVSILLCNATAYHQYLHCLLCNAYSLNCVFQSCHQVVQALTSLDKEIMRNSNQFQLKLSNIGSSSVLVAKSSVEDLLHERGVAVSHETVRFWWHRFGRGSPLKSIENECCRRQRLFG